MVTVLNNSTQGRYDIWPLGDVSGTSSKGKKMLMEKLWTRKTVCIWARRYCCFYLLTAEQGEVNTELSVALADCTYIQKTGASFPYETVFMSKNTL